MVPTKLPGTYINSKAEGFSLGIVKEVGFFKYP